MRRAGLLLLALAGCGHAAPSATRDASIDARAAVTTADAPPDAVDAAPISVEPADTGHVPVPHRKYGSEYPVTQLAAGTGISVAKSGITWTVSNTSTANVSSVTCSGSVSCSPTTGAVVVTGTNATVSSGTGITVTGGPAYTVALTTPVSAGNGGTGASSPNAHAMLATEGASPMTAIGPCSTGQAIVYAGGPTSDPVCSTLTVPGGGTGVTTVPVGYLLTGGIGSAMALLAPGNAGNVVTDTGSVWTSATPPYIRTYSCNGSTSSWAGGAQTTMCSVTVTQAHTTDLVVVSADYHTTYDFSQTGQPNAQNFVVGLSIGACANSPTFTETYDMISALQVSAGAVAVVSNGASMHRAFSLVTTSATLMCAVMTSALARDVAFADANLVVQVVTQ